MSLNLKYKHVIWDWNGTLFDDVFLCADIMNNMLKRRNMPQISVEEYRRVFTFPVKDYYEKLGHKTDDENWEVISHEFINEYERRKLDFKLYSEAKKILQKIKDAGITQSILSAYSQKTLEEIVDYFNLSGYFIKLVGLNNIYAASKLDNGKKWMTELGFENGEVLFVGDTLHDYEVALEIGADPVLLTKGHQAEEKLKECGAPLINCLDELEQIIFNHS
jgi:phosphoglycolate phosphatase